MNIIGMILLFLSFMIFIAILLNFNSFKVERIKGSYMKGVIAATIPMFIFFAIDFVVFLIGLLFVMWGAE